VRHRKSHFFFLTHVRLTISHIFSQFLYPRLYIDFRIEVAYSSKCSTTKGGDPPPARYSQRELRVPIQRLIASQPAQLAGFFLLFVFLTHLRYSFQATYPCVAQLVEPSSYTRLVPGSSPGARTNFAEILVVQKHSLGDCLLRTRSPLEISFRLKGRKVS